MLTLAVKFHFEGNLIFEKTQTGCPNGESSQSPDTSGYIIIDPENEVAICKQARIYLQFDKWDNDGDTMMKVNRFKLKKYRIHIIPALALNDSIWELPFERNALIICTKNYWYIASRLPLNEVLYLDFPDVDNEHYLGAFDELNAREIIGFIKNLPLSVTDLYICCSMGASRSAAVAAAVLRMSGRSDRVIWDNSYFKPNTLVYSFLCREAHIFAPHWYIKQLQNINEMAHQKDSGNNSIYDDDRWQIIE